MATTKSTLLGGLISAEKEVTIQALRHISLELKDGDRLGLLGHNGAGKTTLLKTMAGILPPNAGSVTVEGRISPLTSIQLGLDNEATGMENIRIRGRLMGFRDDAINEITPDVAEFTELGDYLDLPIKTYSSGMRMRLSFAVSTAFQPEVILLDEWLGTGDLEFRDKAARRLRQIIQDSRIFVFATHSRDLHRRMSNKGAVMDKGQILFCGELEEAFEFQDKLVADKAAAAAAP
ncbi:ABC transporter ATP-binding protein [Parvularcula marina]|uniref:ABC transporter ATP-binding protein n=2 Tax=Parvularcula marina TaxID=2292771 RepID=A0A371R8J6_9PROT|nr:ABC transporter ATP-binding protein [Parvularcula marina]